MRHTSLGVRVGYFKTRRLKPRFFPYIYAVLLSLLLGRATAHGQNYLTSTGMPTFAAPEPVDLGSVDTSNGNLHLSIPLGSFPQRGSGKSEPVTFDYDSSIWAVQVTGGNSQWETSYLGQAGWRLSQSIAASTGLVPEGNQLNCTSDQYWQDTNGTTHAFHVLTNEYKAGCPTAADAFASDSSGFHIYMTTPNAGSYTVYAPDGSLAWTSSPQTDPNGKKIIAKDSNGNYLSADPNAELAGGGGLYDTLGRTLVLSTQTAPCAGSSYIVCYLVPNSQGGTSSYVATSAWINVKTNFQQSGISECISLCQVLALQSLKLPDGSSYTFKYDCDSTSGNSACGSPGGQAAYYGELIGITLPTGGQISYQYTVFKDAYGNKSEWLTHEQGSNGVITYTPTVLSTCSPTSVGCQQSTAVQTATSSTTYTFTLNNGAWPVQVVKRDMGANLLATITRTYDFSQSCVLIYCHGASFIRPLTETTTIPSSTGNLSKKTIYSYDGVQTANVTAIKQWGYYPGAFPSTPDRATYTSYLTTGTNNINRPLKTTLCNNSGSDPDCPGGGSKVTQTLTTYDAYGMNGSSALAAVTGIAHHDDTSFGASNTQRGNPTLTSEWISGSTYWKSSLSYDTTGQVTASLDAAGHSTSYSYTDNFYTDPGNNVSPTAFTPSRPTNAYITAATDTTGTQKNGYYFGSGKVAVGTDYNNVSSYLHYSDVLDRETEEIDPVGWKLATYSSTTHSDMYTAVGDTSPSTGCSSCQHTQTMLDSWGRTASQILVNNPIGQVNVDSSFDSVGRLQTQSHPYSGSSDPNHVVETFGYDALDRQLSTTHPDSQAQRSAFGANVNAMGGLTSQQGATSSYGYGYPQISEDEAGNQRQQWLDGFGRIIEADEPSSSTSSVATTTVSIGSGSGQESQTFDPCQGHGSSCPQTAWNSGSVYLTVNGYTASAFYGPNGPPPAYTAASDVASALAAAFNGDPSSPVTASASGGSIVLSAKAPGASGNFAFSSSETYFNQSCPPYNPCFGGPVYVVSPASGSLSGGSGGIATSPYYTNYTYDAADHLTKVVQGVQTRTFAYDGLGRKISENTPEAGTVTYAYTTSGGALCSGDESSICRRTDARGVVSAYTYDSVNRLTGVSYTIPGGKNIAAMPNVCTTTPNGTSANACYYYDQGGAPAYAIGRLTEMIDPTGSETTTYYNDGDVKQVSKVISGQTYRLGYAYDAGGDVTQITYPSGRVVYQAYNPIGQLCLISPSSSGCSGTGYYAGSFSYNSPGNLTGFKYGNGVAAGFGYSAPRAQLSSLKYTFGSQTYFNLGYWYQKDSTNCPNGATQNNGAIQCVTDSVDGGRTVKYGYDSLARMVSAKTNGSSGYPQWGLSESYDRYGNRLSQTVTAGSAPSSSLGFGSNNQPTGYTFDLSGNMTVEPLSPPNNMIYDGENRMTAFSGVGGAASYTYDGNGLRVVKSVQSGTTTVSILAGSSVIAEYDNGAAPASPSREYIYNPAGGATTGLLAMIGGGVTTYYHQDDLSVRLTTNGSGSVLTQGGTFPFGESWYQSGITNKWTFTSYQRDGESGLDYALARYYDSRTGTFCSADPLAGSPEDPQSWNRYPYGRNDPINKDDPSGKFFMLLLPLLAEIAPELTAAIPTVITTVTVTATSTSIAVETAALTAEIAPVALAQAPLSPKDMHKFNKAQNNAKKNADKKDCNKFLTDHGINPGDAKNAIGNITPWNGAKSTISEFNAGVFDPQDPQNIREGARGIAYFQSHSVASSFANPNLMAMAQNFGSNVYFKPGGFLSSGGLNSGTIFHEALHNLTGKGDTRLAQQLGLPAGQQRSQDISPELAKHGCK